MGENKKNVITVLLYHSVSNGNLKIDIPPNLFEEQVKFISDNFKIVSYDDLIKSVVNSENIKENIAVFTFDDGYLDFYTDAFPILKKFSIPSKVFLITSAIETGRLSFGKVSNRKFLTYKEIEELSKEQICSFGAHTHTHINLRVTPVKRVVKELKVSYEILKNLLKTTQIDFSYPWGIVYHKNIVRSLYRSAVGGRDGILDGRRKIDLYAIPRIPLKRESFQKFKKRISGKYVYESYFREVKLLFNDLKKHVH